MNAVRHYKPGRTNIVVSVVLFAALAVAIALLFLFKDRLQKSAARLPEQIAAGVRPDMLGGANQLPRFEMLEEFASRLREEYPSLRRLFVTRIGTDNTEKCIYPWSAPAIPQTGLKTIRIPRSGAVLGYLYYNLDTRGERALQLLIDVSIPMLLLAAVLLGWHVWRQERILVTTRVRLAEKGEELFRLERLALAGQLAANLLHDLKKPMLHIRDELRQKPGELDAAAMNEQVSFFFQMLKETNLEQLAASRDDEQEYLDIEDILWESFHLVKYERGNVEVQIEAEPDLPLIHSYKYRLIQLFSNLLLNAFQVLKGKGRVLVTAHQAIQTGGRPVIVAEVADDGPGIPPEQAGHIFEPFYSASGRKDASGLGLYICRTIASTMNGGIQLIDSPLGGAAFRVTLPVELPEDSGTGGND
jgi:signal transduction histidine kinase